VRAEGSKGQTIRRNVSVKGVSDPSPPTIDVDSHTLCATSVDHDFAHASLAQAHTAWSSASSPSEESP